MTAHGAHLFLLGLAAGLALLTTTSYRRVSPAWLRRLLLALGAFVTLRYLAIAVFAEIDDPRGVWWLRRAWFATSVGLTLPSVVALDQLLRHPAMTPAKLLRWFSPFLAAYAAVIVFGNYDLAPAAHGGWMPELSPAWRMLVSVVQSAFVLGFTAIAGFVMWRFPLKPARVALAGLLAAHWYLGFDGILLAAGGWYPWPFLYSEMLALLALWAAFETAAALQQVS